MLTRTALRDAIEADLRDTSNATWTADQLDRAINLALDAYGHANPRQATVGIVGLPSRTVDLSSTLDSADFASLLDVTAVEYPRGEWPPSYVRFDRWGNELTLHVDREPDGSDDARVYYTTQYVIDAATTNPPDTAAELLALGAAGHALHQLASARIETLNDAGDRVARQLADAASARLVAFGAGLARLNRHVTVAVRYRPDQPYHNRDVVQLPEE